MWPRRPFEQLIFHASTLAAMCAAVAALFGNNPIVEGLLGFVIGLVAGLPAYVMDMRRRRTR